MDPITLAITAALSAGAATGATEVAKKSIVEGYEGLKALVKRKFGDHSEVADAVEKLQAKPDSDGRKQTLAEELKGVNAGQDEELLSAARALLEHIKALPNGEQHMQAAIGIGNAIADRGGTAISNVSNWPGNQRRD